MLTKTELRYNQNTGKFEIIDLKEENWKKDAIRSYQQIQVNYYSKHSH